MDNFILNSVTICPFYKETLHIAVFYISYHVSLMKIPYLIVEWLLCYLLLKHFKNVSHLNYLNTFIKDLKINLSNNHRKDVLL